jgi:lactate dehydrogenase-like 2-hydroxyacid dehydrogenase
MAVTILYPEALYPDNREERRIFGPDVNIMFRDTKQLSELSDADCAAADGLMILRQAVTASDFARFTKLRCVVRMGVGYDRIDRKAAAAHQVMVCNVPDYGTTEVADHAIALALALRRGCCCITMPSGRTRRRPGR